MSAVVGILKPYDSTLGLCAILGTSLALFLVFSSSLIDLLHS
ncbi:uncharacterized protein METZ01_LOCUS42567 [marine metagenome]|uniref:Uncharacterized protein n=1 Tax=marine metagenome TaxID=408172 RepID=A0A381RKZ5_9ZZZZ